MLPRCFTSSPTKASCSGVRRAIQPRLNFPSMTMPLWGHSSLVTISSAPVSGSWVMSGCIIAGASGRVHAERSTGHLSQRLEVGGINFTLAQLDELVDAEVENASLAKLNQVGRINLVFA